MNKEQPCYTYCNELLSGGANGTWNVHWRFLACPHPIFTYTQGVIKKQKYYEDAKIRADEEIIIFETPIGKMALPNDPVVIDVLEDLIQYAKIIQAPYNEEQRIQSIQHWKTRGYLDKAESEDSPMDKNFYEKSIIMEKRREHEKRRKSA